MFWITTIQSVGGFQEFRVLQELVTIRHLPWLASLIVIRTPLTVYMKAIINVWSKEHVQVIRQMVMATIANH